MEAEQYRPNFFSGFEQEKNHFNNSNELLNIDWIKNFAKNDNFHRFSIKRDKHAGKPQHVLVAEYDNGFRWWVVALIRDKDISRIDDVPEWEAKYTKKT